LFARVMTTYTGVQFVRGHGVYVICIAYNDSLFIVDLFVTYMED